MKTTKLMLGGNIFGYFTDLQQTQSIIDCARDLQIFAIDTADVYSDGISEEYIGKALKKDRSKWYLASKVGLKSHAPKNGLGKKETIFTKVEKSLKRLQTDYLDLYQMHHFDPSTPLSETIEALEELRKQGKIRQAGVSNYSLDQLKQYPFKNIQMPLNITNFSESQELVRYCEEMDISILAYSSLARGLFHKKYLENSIPQDSRAAISQNVQSDLTPDFLSRLKESYDLVEAHKISLPEIALQWLNNQKAVRRIIVGFRSVEQVLSANKLMESNTPKDILGSIEDVWSGFNSAAAPI